MQLVLMYTALLYACCKLCNGAERGGECCNPMSIPEFEGNRVHKQGPVEKISKNLVAENRAILFMLFLGGH